MIKTMMQGLSMAVADSVPGVSGGTIAFILGFYEQFIGALHGLMGNDIALKKNSVLYLLKFGAGWVLGMGACVLALSKMLESNIYFLSSLFLGFSVAAIPFIVYEERNTMKKQYIYLLFTVLGVAFVTILTWLRSADMLSMMVDFRHISVLQYGYLFAAGAIAVSAMLMPGISGSTLLLILGVYAPAISAVKEVLHFNMQYLPGVAALALGVVFGIIFAAKGIRKGFQMFRPQMVYLIAGLMIGSLYAIIMGPTTLDVPKPPVDFSSFHLLAFLTGIFMLAGLEFVKNRSARESDIQKGGKRTLLSGKAAR